jgi:Ca2+:H+ antiporter
VGTKLLWASLALTPVALAAHYVFDAGDTAVFLLAAAALVPLAWLVGEATEHVGQHTGPGIGGFVNASFGNAPELIIALVAVADGLPDVVRGSITGSIVSNLLLVLGLAVIVAEDAVVDRRSLLAQLALVLFAFLLFLVPSVPGWHGNPDRHSLFLISIPVAAVLLVVYLTTTWRNLKRHREDHDVPPDRNAWPLRNALLALSVATVATAFVSEVLVHTLGAFGRAIGLSQFFIAAVIVALVGNAAEHGGAILVARKGNMRLASEIAVSSSAQVGVFVAPVVALLSWLVGSGLSLSFRPVELAAMAGAAVAAAVVTRDGRSTRAEGVALVSFYAVAVVAFGFAGDR